MDIRLAAMRPRDIVECVQIVAAHPVQAQAPRYGHVIHNLKIFWEGLLGREALRAIVFEGVQDEFTGLGIDYCNLLEEGMKITTYNNHGSAPFLRALVEYAQPSPLG